MTSETHPIGVWVMRVGMRRSMVQEQNSVEGIGRRPGHMVAKTLSMPARSEHVMKYKDLDHAKPHSACSRLAQGQAPRQAGEEEPDQRCAVPPTPARVTHAVSRPRHEELQQLLNQGGRTSTWPMETYCTLPLARLGEYDGIKDGEPIDER
jgi:hypothetical protein